MVSSGQNGKELGAQVEGGFSRSRVISQVYHPGLLDILRLHCPRIGLELYEGPVDEGNYIVVLERPTSDRIHSMLGLERLLSETRFPVVVIGNVETPLPRELQCRQNVIIVSENGIMAAVTDAQTRLDKLVHDRALVLEVTDDSAMAATLAGKIVHLLARFDGPDYERATRLGAPLIEVVRGSPNRVLSVRLGGSEVGEGGAHTLGGSDLVMRVIHDKVGRTARAISDQRYRDAEFFSSDPSHMPHIRLAHHYPPLHYPGQGSSLVIMERVYGPTVSEALGLIHARVDEINALPAEARKSAYRERERLFTTARTLVEDHLKTVSYWTMHAPKLVNVETPNQVNDTYINNLQEIPGVFTRVLGMGPDSRAPFSKVQNNLWKKCAALLMNVLKYDTHTIVRYRDGMPTNNIVAIPEWSSSSLPHENAARTDAIVRKVSSTDPSTSVLVGIDTGYRMMHFLEDFWHFLVTPEAMRVQQYDKKNGHSWWESLPEWYADQNSKLARSQTPNVHHQVMAVFRGVRKMRLLANYAHISTSDVSSGLITHEAHKCQIDRLNIEFKHYSYRAATTLKSIHSEIVASPCSAPKIVFAQLSRGIDTKPSLSDKLVRPYTDLVRHEITRPSARVAAAAWLASAYANRLRELMEQGGGFKYAR